MTSSSGVMKNIQDTIGGVFKFQLNVLHFASTVCAIKDMNPEQKVFFKLLFVPLLMLILISIYILSLLAERHCARSRKKWDLLSRRCALAIMFALLFSYQKLAASSFSLVHCTQVNGESYLFMDAETECYQVWQSIVLIYLFLCIFPFSFYIALAPALLKGGYISLRGFFFGCLFPFPMIIIWAFRYALDKSQKVPVHDDAVSVYKLLQGPYRDFELPGILKHLCWSGVLLVRRLALILCATFIQDTVFRLSFMFVICFIALMHHVITQPCKDRKGNHAGTISSGALLIICNVNLMRAAWESANYIPTGPNKQLIDIYNNVEDSLILWIPLAGVAIIFTVLVCKLSLRLIDFLRRKCKGKVHSLEYGNSNPDGSWDNGPPPVHVS